MGRINGSVTQKPDAYEYWIDWNESNINNANNTSTVSATVYIKCNSHTSYENNRTSTLSINGQTFSNTLNINLSPGTTVTLISGSTTVTHNSDGSKTITISASSALPNGSGWGPKFGSASANVSLTTIGRYAEINSAYVESTGLTTAVIRYSVSKSASIYCSVDKALWGGARVKNTTSGTFTVTGLTPNTKHSFSILARATDSGLDRVSSEFYGTTKDIARISSVSNFEHGSNASVSITNPASLTLSLIMKIGDTQVLSRTAKAGSNTITFSDAELDNIYKKYGTGSSLTATFVASGSGYTNSKTCTITLKGNQKTGRTNVSGSWKRGKIWTNVNGTWKRAVVWTNVNGTWKRCI